MVVADTPPEVDHEREYAEELLGTAEDYDTTEAPFDYDTWTFGAQMNAAVAAGHVRAYVLGLGVNPLTFAVDLLTTMVIDASTYDEAPQERRLQRRHGRQVGERSQGRQSALPRTPGQALRRHHRPTRHRPRHGVRLRADRPSLLAFLGHRDRLARPARRRRAVLQPQLFALWKDEIANRRAMFALLDLLTDSSAARRVHRIADTLNLHPIKEQVDVA